MSTLPKVIKHTTIPCDVCKTWRLTKVELSNGDNVLKCFHCNEMKWEILYGLHRRSLSVIPIEKILMLSQDEYVDRYCEVMTELS